MFVRSALAVLILIVVLNKNLKNIVYDNFPSESKKHMFMRLVTGCFGILTMNFVVKYFNLSTIAVIINLNPIFTMLLGYLLLKENVTRMDIVCLFLTFGAVLLVILGMK